MEKRRSKYPPSQKDSTRKKETTNTGKPPSATPGETQEKSKKDKADDTEVRDTSLAGVDAIIDLDPEDNLISTPIEECTPWLQFQESYRSLQRGLGSKEQWSQSTIITTTTRHEP
jgi:hypothetical protein